MSRDCPDHEGSSPRLGRSPARRPHAETIWSVEMFEPVLRNAGIPYSVVDLPQVTGADSSPAAIDFSLPTEIYHNPAGDLSARVRLNVDGGRLSVTAPEMYATGAIRRTTEPPPNSDGTQQIIRIEDGEGKATLDLMMDACDDTRAVLRMDTIQTAFSRHDILTLAEMFVRGLDLLDAMVDIHELRLPGGPSAL